MGPGHFAAGAEIRNPSMLPGFRFLFAAILLSASILVFGLGAAALLRATHEEYVSNPSWRNGPQEQVFAQAVALSLAIVAVLAWSGIGDHNGIAFSALGNTCSRSCYNTRDLVTKPGGR